MNPLAELEAILLNPPATGACVTRAPAESTPAGKAGLKRGDIIVSVDGAVPADLPSLYAALRPKGDKQDERGFRVLRESGKTEDIRFKGWPISFISAIVRKGEPAWKNVPDTKYEPDFSGLADREIWLRNSLGDELAGFEAIFLKNRGGRLEVNTLFRLGGEGEHAWDYRTRGESVHRLERGLPVLETRFWEGAPDKEKLKGDVKLSDGNWSGRHGTAEGDSKEVNFAAEAPMLTAYTVTLLPLTMPLKAGASVTICLTGDGGGKINERSRIECVGLRKTQVGGKEIEAWCFAWRHYGLREDKEDEKFWVSNDRKLVRIDWGPGYGDCWCELVEGRDSLGKLPVKVE